MNAANFAANKSRARHRSKVARHEHEARLAAFRASYRGPGRGPHRSACREALTMLDADPEASEAAEPPAAPEEDAPITPSRALCRPGSAHQLGARSRNRKAFAIVDNNEPREPRLPSRPTSAPAGGRDPDGDASEAADGGDGALDRGHYFGAAAKRDFFGLYRRLARQTDVVDDVGGDVAAEYAERLRVWSDSEDDEHSVARSVCGRDIEGDEGGGPNDLADGSSSPRHRFARGLAVRAAAAKRHGGVFSLPEPLFVRAAGSDGLDLSHRAYGDELAILLSDMIGELPSLRRLSMRSNRLSDRGVEAILAAVCGGARLEALDLSQNKLDGRAIDMLATFLRTENCVLTELELDGADVDDAEIRDLVRALEGNASLRALSLSGNFLGGAAEKLAHCAPADRGAFAVARALEVNGTLTKLDLSWNQLGAQSGALIGGALIANRCLEWFSLAFNCVGDDGAMAVGRALDGNGTLCHVDLSSNNVRNRGAQVVAEGLRENTRLAYLTLAGNPVGSLGGRALLASLNYARRPRTIDLGGCELSGDDRDPGRYDPSAPAGTYDLDLAKPFEWMVAKQLRWLAVTRAGCRFTSLAVAAPDDDGRIVKKKIRLLARRALTPGAVGWEPPAKALASKNPISRELSEKIVSRINASLAARNSNRFRIRFDASVPERFFWKLSLRASRPGRARTGRSQETAGKRVRFDGGTRILKISWGTPKPVVGFHAGHSSANRCPRSSGGSTPTTPGPSTRPSSRPLCGAPSRSPPPRSRTGTSRRSSRRSTATGRGPSPSTSWSSSWRRATPPSSTQSRRRQGRTRRRRSPRASGSTPRLRADSDRRFLGDPEKVLVPPSRRTRGGFVGTGRFFRLPVIPDDRRERESLKVFVPERSRVEPYLETGRDAAQAADRRTSRAAESLQARLRGFFGRIDAAQQAACGNDASSVAGAMAVVEERGGRESSRAGVAKSIAEFTRHAKTAARSSVRRSRARFKMKSVLAATTSRKMRLEPCGIPASFEIRFNSSVPERVFESPPSGRRGTTGSLKNRPVPRDRGKGVRFDSGREFEGVPQKPLQASRSPPRSRSTRRRAGPGDCRGSGGSRAPSSPRRCRRWSSPSRTRRASPRWKR